MINPMLFPTVFATMQQIQKAVAAGYLYYVCGTVSVQRVSALMQKLHERYVLNFTTSQRDHARRQGKATFKVVLWPLYGELGFAWWLLRTDGSHPLLGMENWRDARQQRVEWPWWYELVQLPVEKALRAKYLRKDGSYRIKPVTWTWRLRLGEVERIKTSVRHFATLRDQRLAELIRSLHRAPGFRGIRHQSFELFAYMRRQCHRSQHHTVTIPTSIPGMRRAGSSKVPLSVLLKRARQGKASWFPNASMGVFAPALAPPMDSAAADTESSPITKD